MERLWRGPIPNALKRYFEAQTRVRQGPYKVRQLKALEESDVGAAGGARAHATSLTGDVLGGLPTKRSQGLRGNPAHRQGRKWVAFELVVKDGLYWMAVARNVGM